MASLDPGLVEQFLSAGKTALADRDVPAQQAFLAEATARLVGRSPEDRREAAKIAVETVKLFFTISTAVLVVIGAFVQFARTNGVPWVSLVMGVFFFAALCLGCSMIAGFNAISRIYRRADGRLEPNETAWSTEAVKRYLGWQGKFGLASLGALVAALAIWGSTASAVTPAIAITISGKTIAMAGRSLAIEGSWTALKVKTSSGHELSLPPQGQPVSLTCQ
jgi:hypothetical protein